MFRSARWRYDKTNKIKTVFKFQFFITQVTQLNVDSLAISVSAGDIGKPTARLEKGVFRRGSCRWKYPIYETVTFTQDSKTGKINERTYHFVVSTVGSSKSYVVGEASVDLADYAEATKVSNLSLALKNSKFNGVLHVAIQRLQGNIYRDVEETKDANKIQDRSLNHQLSNSEAEEGIESYSNEARLPNDDCNVSELNGDSRTSSGSDLTISSSDSSSGLNTPHEPRSRNDLLQGPMNFVSSWSHTSASRKPTANAPAIVHEEQQQLQWEWSAESDRRMSTDDAINGCQRTRTRERPEDASDSEIKKLNAEIVALARQVDLSELELQTLRKQIVRESKRGQDLTREITSLKEERNALKGECEKLKAVQKCIEDAKGKNKSRFECGDTRVRLDEIRQELNYEKDLNANLRLQLQKTQESNAELILAVTDLEEMLEQKNREISDPPNKSQSSENATLRIESEDDEEQKALDELVKDHADAKEVYVLERKIMDLRNEIEIYKRDKEEIEMQTEKLALDYEILKQENHDTSCKLQQSELQEQLKMQCECSSSTTVNVLESQIESLQNELRKKSEEHSDSLMIINELETQIGSMEDELKKQRKEYSDSVETVNRLEAHVKSLEDELDKQSLRFEADLEAITHAKVELEQRAIGAEEALRKTRLKNASTAEKIQEEFKRLSAQVASMFDANEKVAMKAWTEANRLQMQKSQLEEMLRKAKIELQSVRDDYEAKLEDLSNQLKSKEDQIEKMILEIEDKSRQLQLQEKNEEEHVGSFSQEIERLKAEIEKLKIENSNLSDQAEQTEDLKVEMERLKSAIELAEDQVQKCYAERSQLASVLALAKKEAEKLMEELERTKSLKDEKEKTMDRLRTDVEALRAQCDDLKHSLSEDELENEKLKKQVLQLKGDLRKKDDTIAGVEKKLKESNKRAALSDTAKTNLKNKPASISYGSKEAANLREKIKLLEDRIKLKETALETSANAFAEKERDLLNKIKELEDRMEEVDQKNAAFSDNSCEKLPEDNFGMRSTGENLSCMAWMSKGNGNTQSAVNSYAIMPDKQTKTCNGEASIDELTRELNLLKDRNKSMETELKEMQERYSEISLKFAEVEGERQKLVMTVRYLKNAKKS